MIRSVKIIIVIALVFLSGIASGQSYTGAFIGANSSRLTGDSPSKAKYNGYWGVNTGIQLDIKLSRMIWISLQPSYSQEGTRLEYSVKGKVEPVDSIQLRLNYFSEEYVIRRGHYWPRFLLQNSRLLLICP